MGLFTKISLGTLAGLLLLADCTPVYAKDSFYEPCYQEPEGDLKNYMVLEEDFGEYEVQEGDCLWSISEKMLGCGSEYLRLAEMNPDVITDPDLIYPHTRLQLKRQVYVRKRTGVAGTQMEGYRFGALTGWTVGIAQAGEAFSNFAFMGADSARVVCLIRDKEQASVDTLSDWESGRNAIEEYAQEHYGDSVTDLAFQHYQSERGDEIYLFSYIYTIKGEWYGLKGTLPVHVSHAVCQTEHIQAEFTGFATEEGIVDIVRYLAAGFEELPSTGTGEFTVNNSNMMLEPLKEWELSGIHNPFGWIEEYFDGIFSQASQAEPEEKSAKERILF